MSAEVPHTCTASLHCHLLLPLGHSTIACVVQVGTLRWSTLHQAHLGRIAKHYKAEVGRQAETTHRPADAADPLTMDAAGGTVLEGAGTAGGTPGVRHQPPYVPPVLYAPTVTDTAADGYPGALLLEALLQCHLSAVDPLPKAHRRPPACPLSKHAAAVLLQHPLKMGTAGQPADQSHHK